MMTDDELNEIEARAAAATCKLTEEYAVKHLGYEWWSWVGTPVRGTPGYPSKMRVRQLLSPGQLQNERWKRFLADPSSDAKPADGSEPLDYTYCSSGCTVQWPPKRTVNAFDVVKTDVPALVAEVRRLRVELSKLRAANGHLEQEVRVLRARETQA